ncbi:Hypothetical protein NTJ_10096 [Nesidiocoris tenuis]|uniref:Uncharacterized protein n=1 Tax=Nesidiocoris tenuis TaxID=355587 RepID=A0ABN7B3F9_9HEMI|nr:Hypothetical protein NTJ_10096 [Nesidiocoris tenuis]
MTRSEFLEKPNNKKVLSPSEDGAQTAKTRRRKCKMGFPILGEDDFLPRKASEPIGRGLKRLQIIWSDHVLLVVAGR